jgi:DNA-binding NarL/FixJ family response regulator
MEVVGSASSPDEAIRKFEETRPSIVLLDIHLKGGSGIQVLEALQSKLNETRFVVFTAHPSAQLKQACARLGAWAVVDKASNLSELNACFEQVRFPAQ